MNLVWVGIGMFPIHPCGLIVIPSLTFDCTTFHLIPFFHLNGLECLNLSRHLGIEFCRVLPVHRVMLPVPTDIVEVLLTSVTPSHFFNLNRLTPNLPKTPIGCRVVADFPHP